MGVFMAIEAIIQEMRTVCNARLPLETKSAQISLLMRCHEQTLALFQGKTEADQLESISQRLKEQASKENIDQSLHAFANCMTPFVPPPKPWKSITSLSCDTRHPESLI